MADWTISYLDYPHIIMEVDADIYDNTRLAADEIDAAIFALSELNWRTNTQPIRVYMPACGTGRHVHLLAKSGYRVTGTDFTRPFLRKAALRTQGVDPLPEYRVWDMRKPYLYARDFDLCLLLGGSFGFFSDAGNWEVLASIRAVLREGAGGFVFDAATPEHAKRMAEVHPYTSTRVETPSFGVVRDERWRWWDARTNTLKSRKRHTQAVSGGKVLLDVEYAIKVYSAEQIIEELRIAGFDQTVVIPTGGKSTGLMATRHTIAATC